MAWKRLLNNTPLTPGRGGQSTAEGEIKMKIKYKRFNEILYAAQKQPDLQLFLAEYGLPEWIIKEITEGEQAVVKMLMSIHHILYSTPKELIAESGLSQTKFAARFNIPLRTVQDWCGERRKMPNYLKFMVAEILDMLNVKIVF